MAQQTSEADFKPGVRVRRKGYNPAGLYSGTVIFSKSSKRVFVSWDYGVNGAGRPPVIRTSELELR